MIRCFCDHRDAKMSAETLKLLIETFPNEPPRRIVFVRVLDVCVETKDLDRATDIMRLMRNVNVPPKVLTVTNLIRELCVRGRSGNAKRVLGYSLEMNRVPSENAFATLMQLCFDKNEISRVDDVIMMMRKYGVVAKQKTLSDVVRSYLSIMNINVATRVLTAVTHLGHKPSYVTYFALIRRLIDTRARENMNIAMRLFQEMKRRRISLQSDLYSVLISASHRVLGQIDLSESLMKELVANSDIKMTFRPYYTIIKCYAHAVECPDQEKMMNYWLKRMREHGFFPGHHVEKSYERLSIEMPPDISDRSRIRREFDHRRRRDGRSQRLDSSDRRLDSSDRRLDSSDRRLDSSDRRLDSSDRRLDSSGHRSKRSRSDRKDSIQNNNKRRRENDNG